MIQTMDEDVFKKQLQDVWAVNDIRVTRTPCIGGKEIDFFIFYQYVIKRGGAQMVSEKKKWKDIVKDFGLPLSCTSASFIMRNHYQKYLLAYEQKYFFGRENNLAQTEIFSKPRKQVKLNEDIQEDEQIQSEINNQDNQGDILQQLESNNNFIELFNIKMVPETMRRIKYAFQCIDIEEIVFALNGLLVFSKNANEPLNLEMNEGLLQQLTAYLCQLVPYLQKKLIGDFELRAGQKLNQFLINEHAKMVLSIILNLSHVEKNELNILNEINLFSTILELFLWSDDSEIVLISMSIITLLSKHLVLNKINYVGFLDKLKKSFFQKNSYLKELALQILKNLLISKDPLLLENYQLELMNQCLFLVSSQNQDLKELVLEVILQMIQNSNNILNSFAISQNVQKLINQLILQTEQGNKQHEKIRKTCIQIISTIIHLKDCFQSFEDEIFILAVTDTSLTKLFSSFLFQINN